MLEHEQLKPGKAPAVLRPSGALMQPPCCPRCAFCSLAAPFPGPKQQSLILSSSSLASVANHAIDRLGFLTNCPLPNPLIDKDEYLCLSEIWYRGCVDAIEIR